MLFEHKKNFCVLVFFVLFSILSIFPQKGYARSEWPPYEKSNDKIRLWFLDPNNSLDGWKDDEKLGAAEFLYMTLDERFPDFDVTRIRIENILSSLDNKLNTKNFSDPHRNKIDVTRSILLKILIGDKKDKEFDSLTNQLIKIDPQNGLFWMFKAEYKFLRGDFWKCIRFCHKAIDSPSISFQDENSRKNIIKALKKSSLLDKNSLLLLTLVIDWDRTYTITVRHTFLLSNLYLMQKNFSFPNQEKLPILAFPERQYLSYLACGQTTGSGFRTMALHNNMSRQNMLYWIDRNTEKSVSQFEMINKEQALLQFTRSDILSQRKTIDSFVLNASEHDLCDYHEHPEEWWQKHRPEIDPNQPRPDYQTWRNFWTKFQADIEISNMPPKQPDGFQPGNLSPDMLPGMRPKISPKNKD